LLGLAVMKMFGKRGSGVGSAVLDAPEENLASEAEWTAREPAPAGMLQRARVAEDGGGGGYFPQEEPVEEVYKPRRESVRHRLQMGVPKSVAGRIIVGAGALLVLGVVAGAVLWVRSFLLHDARFVVATSSEIQIAGNDHLTREQVLSVFGSDLERNIFKVPLAERRADLERLPWVAHATVMRLLPNIIRVSLTERTPVAFVRQGTQIGLVDAEGVLLDMPERSAGDPHYSFPVLTGLSADDPLSARAARMDVYKKFMSDLDSSGEKLTESLSEVDVSNPEDVKALVASGSTDILVHFGDENFLTRYKLFQQNLPTWKTLYPKLASVDTRYEHQMVLEMQAGTSVPVTGSGATSLPAAPAASAATAAAVPAKAAAPTKVVAKPEVKAKSKPAVKVVSRHESSKQKLAAEIAAARKATPPHTKPIGAQKP